MSSIKILHEAAMEYFDMAKRAKMQGDMKSYKLNMEKAYTLEKEAALTMPEQPGNNMWRYILLRSAGWLAFQCGYFEEAKRLADAGLTGNPNSIEKKQLEDLSTAAIAQIQSYPATLSEDTLLFSGILTSANIQDNYIVIKVNGTSKRVSVENEKTREVGRLFLGDIVLVKARKSAKGTPVLEVISRAA